MGSNVLVEFDSSGQEMRLMADFSQDVNLLNIFRSEKPYDDAHSFTGSRLPAVPIPFDDFLVRYAAKEDYIAGPKGLRYQGKFTNLSCQYRIGIPALRFKARIDYGMNVDLETAEIWKSTYLRTYPGVPQYWKNSIKLAKAKGYSESLGGSRYYIDQWSKKMLWQSESSAINQPIQGTGADMKYLAINTLRKYFPSLRPRMAAPRFRMDMHDGIFYVMENSRHLARTVLEMRDVLSELPYKKLWGWEPSIPFPWDAAMGPSWGELEEVK